MDILPCNLTHENDSCIIDVNSDSVGSNPNVANIWTLYFDGSKMQEGFGVGYTIVDS